MGTIILYNLQLYVGFHLVNNTLIPIFNYYSKYLNVLYCENYKFTQYQIIFSLYYN